MNTVEQSDTAVIKDDLLQLELRIARRADELAQSCGRPYSGNLDRDCWLQAENEVLSQIDQPAFA